MEVLKRALCLTGLLLLTSCGGGGGTEALLSYLGQYIDAPVQGLRYVATPSGVSGTTDQNGFFNFRAGDSITFSIQTPQGEVHAGTYSPTTPTATDMVSHAVVTDLSGGLQIAQVLQSLGTVSETKINVSNVSITAQQVQELNQFIAASGTTVQPSIITVTPAAALATTVNYLSSNLVNPSPPISIADLLSPSTLYYASTNNESGFFRMNANRTWVNTLNDRGGTWAPIDLKTYQTISNIQSYSCGTMLPCQYVNGTVKNTITVPTVNLQGGTFYAIREVTFDGQMVSAGGSAPVNQTSNWSGVFRKVKTDNNSFSVANLAGKTLTIQYGGPGVGNSCSDGVIQYAFGASDMTYSKSCQVGAQRVSPFYAGGTVADSVDGVIKLTDASLPTPYYMGIVSGSLNSGELAVTVQNALPTFLRFTTR